MADVKTPVEIKDYADGWISERKGTDVPKFLKLSYIVIALGCLAYFIYYMFGEVNHADRGVLVRELNQATQSSPGFMYFVALLIVIFAVVVAAFAFRKPHED